MNGEIREFFFYQLFIMQNHITDYRGLYKTARVFSLCFKKRRNIERIVFMKEYSQILR